MQYYISIYPIPANTSYATQKFDGRPHSWFHTEMYGILILHIELAYKSSRQMSGVYSIGYACTKNSQYDIARDILK